ncbi:MAG: AAA family ATPase [Hyphomonadaceae bacterium]
MQNAKDRPAHAGAKVSIDPLNQPIQATVFSSAKARTKREVTRSLRDWAPIIQSTSARSKAELPWLKLAVFGDKKSEKGGSLRHDANVAAVTGIEGDYDGELMPMGEAAERLEAAGVAAMLYETPSHSPDAPRWRVLCPLSREHAPKERKALAEHLDVILGGVLKSESFALSQSYFYGRDESRSDAAPGVLFVEGACIDTKPRPDLRPKESNADNDDSRSGRHFREALQSMRAGFSYEKHLDCLDSDLFDYAQEARGESTKGERDWERAREHCEKDGTLPGALLDRFDDLGDDEKAELRSNLQFYAPGEYDSAPPPYDFVEGVFYDGTLAAIFGDAGSGKTFSALHAAMCVQHGLPFMRLETAKRNVLYVTLEGEGAFNARMRAWTQRYGPKGGVWPPIAHARGSLDIRNKPERLALIAEARRLGSQVIFIDTLSRAFAGGDENSSTDMGQLIAAADSVRRNTGACVILIHHVGKNAGAGLRGHSSLKGAVDTAIEIMRVGESADRLAKVRKQKDGPDDVTFAFAIESQSTDIIGARGIPVTAGVLVETENMAHLDNLDALSEREREALHVLRRMEGIAELCGRTVSKAQWRAKLYEGGWGPKKNESNKDQTWRKAWSDTLRALEEKGHVRLQGESVLSGELSM